MQIFQEWNKETQMAQVLLVFLYVAINIAPPTPSRSSTAVFSNGEHLEEHPQVRLRFPAGFREQRARLSRTAALSDPLGPDGLRRSSSCW